jgi:hypothetical protein
MDPLPPIVPARPQVLAPGASARIDPDARRGGSGEEPQDHRRRRSPAPAPRPAGAAATEPTDDRESGDDGRPHIDITV